MIGVTFTNLSRDDAVQMALPLEGLRAPTLDGALDSVRDRFGSKAITRGVLLGRPEGFRVPLLPD